MSLTRHTGAQRSSSNDLGNQELFRQYCRDKEMSEDDDPFLLIRGRICRKERTPPSTFVQEAMKLPCLCWLMERWRYLYPFWLNLRMQRSISWLCIEKRNSCSSSVKFVFSSTKFRASFLSSVWTMDQDQVTRKK